MESRYTIKFKNIFQKTQESVHKVNDYGSALKYKYVDAFKVLFSVI